MARRRSLYVALASTALALTAALTSVSPAGAQSNCSVSAEDQSVDGEEAQLIDLLNGYRGQRGLPAVSLDPALTRAAAWYSRDMAAKNYFRGDHVDSLGRDIPTRVTQCGASWTYVTENIAAGRASAEEAFEQWRLSPSHESAMRHPDVTRAGIGRAFRAGTEYGWYWTLDLAAGGSAANVPLSTSAPAITNVVPPEISTAPLASGSAPTPPPLPPSPAPAVELPPPPPAPPAESGTEVVPPAIDLPPAQNAVTPLVTGPEPATLQVEGTAAPGVLPGVCAILQAQKVGAHGQLAAVQQAVAGSLGVAQLEAVAAQLAEVRDRTVAQLDAARAAAGCADQALDLLTAATAS